MAAAGQLVMVRSLPPAPRRSRLCCEMQANSHGLKMLQRFESESESEPQLCHGYQDHGAGVKVLSKSHLSCRARAPTRAHTGSRLGGVTVVLRVTATQAGICNRHGELW